MPHLSSFYGIVIYMYWNDHEPAHFHALYGEYDAEIGIAPIGLRDGFLPARARKLALEWARLHQQELLENWERARKKLPLNAIDPLD